MYNASLKYKWDNKNVRDYAAEQGREEGLKRGREEGMELGLEQGRQEERAKALTEKKQNAREMLADNLPVEQIARYTALTIEEIKAL